MKYRGKWQFYYIFPVNRIVKFHLSSFSHKSNFMLQRNSGNRVSAYSESFATNFSIFAVETSYIVARDFHIKRTSVQQKLFDRLVLSSAADYSTAH